MRQEDEQEKNKDKQEERERKWNRLKKRIEALGRITYYDEISYYPDDEDNKQVEKQAKEVERQDKQVKRDRKQDIWMIQNTSDWNKKSR